MLFLAAVVFTTHFPLAHADSKLIAGTNVVYAYSNRVLYRSDDGGATFAPRNTLADPVTIAIDPTNDDVLYAVSRTPKLERSGDGGAHWSTVTLPSRYIAPVALVVRSPSTLIVAGDCPLRNIQVDSGVWISGDGGESWSRQGSDCVNTVGVEPASGGIFVNSATNIVAQAPWSPVRYAILNSIVIVSYDGGASWQRFGSEPMFARSLAIDPITGRLFAATGGGVYVSENGVPFWRRIAEMPPDAATVSVAGTTLFIEATSGAYRAPLPALAPLTRLAGLPGVPAVVQAMAVDPHRPLVYAVASGVLWRSSDRGEHWESFGYGAAAPITVDGDGCVFGPGSLPAPSQLIADPQRHGWLYAVSGGALYESPDGGHAWHRLPIDGEVYQIAMNGDHLYAGTAKGLFVTADAGATWTCVAPWFTHAIAVAPSRPSTLYRDASEYNMERSDDGGATWHYVRKPSVRYVDAIVVDPRDDRSVWISSNDGAFRSGDGGATWERIGFLTTLLFDADGTSLHVIGASFSDMPGEWDAVVRAERRRPAR